MPKTLSNNKEPKNVFDIKKAIKAVEDFGKAFRRLTVKLTAAELKALWYDEDD